MTAQQQHLASLAAGQKIIAAKLEAARQQRALAAIDTRAIVRQSVSESLAGLKRFRTKQAAAKLAKPTPRAAQSPPTAPPAYNAQVLHGADILTSF